MSGLEALCNAVIGLVVSWVVTWLVLGFTPVQSIGVTGLFFVISFTRSYLLRRLFLWLTGR